MNNTPVAGIPSANVHQQKILNIVRIGDGAPSTVICTVYNRAEAARCVASLLGMPAKTVEARIKRAFAGGGRKLELEGLRVFKTNTPAPWRGAAYHQPKPGPAARKRRLAWAYKPDAPVYTTWRSGVAGRRAS